MFSTDPPSPPLHDTVPRRGGGCREQFFPDQAKICNCVAFPFPLSFSIRHTATRKETALVLARARSLPYTSPWPRIPLSSARLSFHRSPPHPPQAPLMPPLPGCRSPPRPARCRAHPSAPSHRPETSSASPRHPNSNHYQRAVVLSWSVIFVCMILGSPSTSDHCEPPPGLLKTSMLVTIEWRPTHRPTKYHRPPSDGVPPPLRPPPVPPGRRRGACPSCRRGGHGPPHYASPGGFPCGAKVTTPPTYMTPLSVFRTPEGSYKGVGGGVYSIWFHRSDAAPYPSPTSHVAQLLISCRVQAG